MHSFPLYVWWEIQTVENAMRARYDAIRYLQQIIFEKLNHFSNKVIISAFIIFTTESLKHS